MRELFLGIVPSSFGAVEHYIEIRSLVNKSYHLLSSGRHHNEGRVDEKIYPVLILIILVTLKRHFSNGYQSLLLLSVPERG
ncbi:hypothetical protein BpHYR1_007530 [Brachionus plicatilis]|uniref:Uncharacterized protein n=1 Tax=Brachionus plicatilis TaxID=10195 RepID=A0A3M7PTG6_BRAPC|nr:hypothetical protein BpHYR1_007530 [Brachionus plicatilis]